MGRAHDIGLTNVRILIFYLHLSHRGILKGHVSDRTINVLNQQRTNGVLRLFTRISGQRRWIARAFEAVTRRQSRVRCRRAHAVCIRSNFTLIIIYISACRTGADYDVVHRLSRTHLLLLFRISRREGFDRREWSYGFHELR